MKKEEYGISHKVQTYFSTDPDGHVNICFDPHDHSYNLIIDETALKSLNAVLSEKLTGHKAKDPNTIGFIKEYCERWLDQMYSDGYVILENIADKD